MSSFELSLKILVDLMGLSDGLITKELIWDLKRHQKLGSISTPSKLLIPAEHPVHDVLNSLFLTMDHLSLEVGVEVSWVSQDFEVAADSILSLILGLTLNVDLVGVVQGGEDFIEIFKELEWRLVIKLHE